MLMLSFGLIIFSIVSIAAASAQTPTPSVKITSPTKGQKLSDGIKTLTITGTSSDRPDIKCTVGILINDIKPYKTVLPSGTGKGAEDFSSWKYTFTPSDNSAIKEGNNRVTSKITCANAKGTSTTIPSTQSVKYYSVNFTGTSASYKPITPSQGVNFAEMKKPKNASPLSTAAATRLDNGIKEHKNAVESALNKSANNGSMERKNNIAENKNAINNGLNVSRPSSASSEKGTVFVPPYNIKANSGTNNSISNTSPSLTSSNQPTAANATNVIPGKVVISNQSPSKPNSTSLTPKQTNNLPASNLAASTPTNVIPGKVVISNQSNNPTTNTTSNISTAPPSQPKPASIPTKPSITITINNNNSAQKSQNTTSTTDVNSQNRNSNISNNNTITTIINESQGLGSSIPGSLPNGLAPSLIFPIPFHELETTKLPNPPSQLQTNPSILNSNIGPEKTSNYNSSPPNVAIKQSTLVVNGQEKVTLDGGASSSPNGAIVSYSWTPLRNSPPLIASQDTNSPVLSFAVPNVQSDKQFAYKLTVTDSTGQSSSATVDILARKSGPTTTASTSSTNQLSSNPVTHSNANSQVQASNSNSNQNVNVSTAIAQSQNIPSKFLVNNNNNQVNIPNQYSTNQNNLTAVNILQNMSPTAVNDNTNPAGLSASLSSNLATNQPNIAAQLAPPFTSATTSTQNVGSTQNLSSFGKVVPVAVAGPDQIANGGSTVVVDGSRSHDPAGGFLSYKWDQISGPRTAVGGSETSGWSFKLPEVSENALLKLQLTVTNKDGVSSTDYLNIMDRAVTDNSDKNHNHDGDEDHHG
jgi:hypothetical protein